MSKAPSSWQVLRLTEWYSKWNTRRSTFPDSETHLQYMLDRREIVSRGTLSPKVTPMVRIPPNGGEMNQWIAKQVLDIGVFGIVFPHVSTVEEARNAVGACRYPP